MCAAAGVVRIIEQLGNVRDAAHKRQELAGAHQLIETPVGWTKPGNIGKYGFASGFAPLVDGVASVEGGKLPDQLI